MLYVVCGYMLLHCAMYFMYIKWDTQEHIQTLIWGQCGIVLPGDNHGMAVAVHVHWTWYTWNTWPSVRTVIQLAYYRHMYISSSIVLAGQSACSHHTMTGSLCCGVWQLSKLQSCGLVWRAQLFICLYVKDHTAVVGWVHNICHWYASLGRGRLTNMHWTAFQHCSCLSCNLMNPSPLSISLPNSPPSSILKLLLPPPPNPILVTTTSFAVSPFPHPIHHYHCLFLPSPSLSLTLPQSSEEVYGRWPEW